MTMRYKITGVDRNGKRFKILTNNRMHALSINLWKGSVWIKRPKIDAFLFGQWKLLKRVY